jgi:hypothetical protein
MELYLHSSNTPSWLGAQLKEAQGQLYLYLYLSVNNRVAQKFGMERFNLKKLNEVAVKEQYQVKISNRFATSENLDYDEMTGGGGGGDMDINRDRKSNRT